jgi:hypothetical protein
VWRKILKERKQERVEKKQKKDVLSKGRRISKTFKADT